MRAYEFYVTTLPVRAELGRVRLAGADTGVEIHVTAELGYKQSTGCSIFNIHQPCVCILRSRIAALWTPLVLSCLSLVIAAHTFGDWIVRLWLRSCCVSCSFTTKSTINSHWLAIGCRHHFLPWLTGPLLPRRPWLWWAGGSGWIRGSRWSLSWRSAKCEIGGLVSET